MNKKPFGTIILVSGEYDSATNCTIVASHCKIKHAIECTVLGAYCTIDLAEGCSIRGKHTIVKHGIGCTLSGEGSRILAGPSSDDGGKPKPPTAATQAGPSALLIRQKRIKRLESAAPYRPATPMPQPPPPMDVPTGEPTSLSVSLAAPASVAGSRGDLLKQLDSAGIPVRSEFMRNLLAQSTFTGTNTLTDDNGRAWTIEQHQGFRSISRDGQVFNFFGDSTQPAAAAAAAATPAKDNNDEKKAPRIVLACQKARTCVNFF